jgi:hypothetical protein
VHGEPCKTFQPRNQVIQFCKQNAAKWYEKSAFSACFLLRSEQNAINLLIAK